MTKARQAWRRKGSAPWARTARCSAGEKRLVAIALAGVLAATTGCRGSDDAADVPPSAPEAGTDHRGWAIAERGLFGHRRAPSPDPALDGGIGAIGYAQGSEAAPPEAGVLRFDHARAAEGLNLMVSGDVADATLSTLEGRVLHRWAHPFEDLDEAPDLEGPHQVPWRRVALADDGSIIAIHSGAALVRLDRNSNVTWVLYERVHHDLDLVEPEDGPAQIFALSRRERVIPEVNPDEPIIDDLIVRVSGTGQLVSTLSLWDAFIASEWAPMLKQLSVREGDVMHANSLRILDAGQAQAFGSDRVSAGCALVCMRDLDMVGVVDLDAGELVWTTQGPSYPRWRGAHDPTVTRAGELMIFDNLGGPVGNSRVLRMVPRTAETLWTYQGDPPGSFASLFCGTARELPNGNILIAESCRGRALEVEPEGGDVVWEFVSDRLAGDDDEFIAALFQVDRIPHPDWLPR